MIVAGPLIADAITGAGVQIFLIAHYHAIHAYVYRRTRRRVQSSRRTTIGQLTSTTIVIIARNLAIHAHPCRRREVTCHARAR